MRRDKDETVYPIDSASRAGSITCDNKCNYYAKQLMGEEKRRGIFSTFFIAMKCSEEKTRKSDLYHKIEKFFIRKK